MSTVKPFIVLIAFAVLCAGSLHAQTAPQVVAAERLAALLPPAWGKLERRHVQTDDKPSLTGAPHASAQAIYTLGSTAAFEASLRIRDDGDIAAGYYKMAAKYLGEDYRDDTQHSLLLAGGRRAEVTEMGEGILMIETFVADRFVVSANCSHATESACEAALEKFDFAAIARLKP